MTIVVAILLVVHGLVHLLGFAKAFRLAALPQLTQPVSPFTAVVWLIASLGFLAAAGSLFLWSRWWWAIGACAIAVSMLAIVPSWSNAKFGTLANLIALVGVVFGFLAQGPTSLRAAYERDVDRALVRVAPAEPMLHVANWGEPEDRGGSRLGSDRCRQVLLAGLRAGSHTKDDEAPGEGD